MQLANTAFQGFGDIAKVVTEIPMATTEHTINDALAAVLRETRRAWSSNDVVRSENTGMLKGSNQRPDILVLEPNVSPVVIETEVLPAITVELEAKSRLGQHLRTNGRTILSSIAVRSPLRLRTKAGQALRADLTDAKDLEIALFTGDSPKTATRWPSSGWVRGSVADLSILTQSASVPPDVIEKAANELVDGVSDAAGLLAEVTINNPGATEKISKELRQEPGEQTLRMATTILANAFVFQETLAGGVGDLATVKSLEELRSTGLTKSAVLAEWRKILKVNYWPIFDIARRILEAVPAASSKEIIERLSITAEKLLENRLMRSHDLTGAVFQRLIVDRKFLAAYYTTPASAALLVGLAVTSDVPPAKGSWANAEDVKSLRVADFACGTGTLLATAYQRIGQLHELHAGDSEAIHPAMMAYALVGCDVLPAAAHLTASMISGAHPTIKYVQSSILTVAYGRQSDGAIALGSLDLLDEQRKLGILDITAKAAEGMGEKEVETWSSLPHASFDLVVMNPPFTRATGQEGKKVGVPNPMFAAFSSSEEEQRLMGKATKRLTDGTSAHGNAGEASIFLVLADRKLKESGALALVMPLSLMSGDAWEDSRRLLATKYSQLILVSISGADGADLSFSADTDMGECIAIGRKSAAGSTRATFVVLNQRPPFPMLGASAAQQIHRHIEEKELRSLEDGPVGGTSLHFGDDIIGQMIEAPLPGAGSWTLSRISDLSLAQTAYQLESQGKVWLPGMPASQAASAEMTTVSAIGEIGPYHADINGSTSNGGVRGPFKIEELKAPLKTTPTYPVLWSHDAKNQQEMAFDGDSQGVPRKGKNKDDEALIEKKIAAVWSTASHCHFNRDFRFNSQSTSMQFTPRRTIGGRAWISVSLKSSDLEKALVAWSNTTLGLLLHWYKANKQQSGRGSVGVQPLSTFPILNVAALDPKKLAAAVKIFDDLSKAKLLPINEMNDDAERKELDRRFATEVLDLSAALTADGGPLDVLRMKLAQEPSIRGQK